MKGWEIALYNLWQGEEQITEQEPSPLPAKETTKQVTVNNTGNATIQNVVDNYLDLLWTASKTEFDRQQWKIFQFIKSERYDPEKGYRHYMDFCHRVYKPVLDLLASEGHTPQDAINSVKGYIQASI